MGSLRHINDVESSTLDMALNVMTKSVFYAIKIGGSAMMVTSKEKPSPGGSIVVTASVAGLNPSMGDIAYCKFPLSFVASGNMAEPSAAMSNPF